MRYLVLTDIHANLEALEACLADARDRKCDQTLVLGDLVGYGGDPNGVIDRVVALKPLAIVRGNHDKVACGVEQAEGFNAVAKSAARWTLDVLTPQNREWVAALRRGRLHLRRARRGARAEDSDAAALPLRPYALPGHVRAVR
jgi:calcineurin-like phosphoesterase family protein